MVIKSIIDKLSLNWSKSAAGNMTNSKMVHKQKAKPKAPAIVAGGSISAGRDIIVGNQTIHHHATSAPKNDSQIARELINFLDNKRVLTDRFEWENPQDCIYSVSDIRSRLSEFLEKQPLGKILEADLKQMQEACKKFLTATQALETPRHHIYGSDMRQILDSFRHEFAVPAKNVVTRYRLSASNDFKKMLLGGHN